MSGSQFQQFNEDLNKMLGSTLTVSVIFLTLACFGMKVEDSNTKMGSCNHRLLEWLE